MPPARNPRTTSRGTTAPSRASRGTRGKRRAQPQSTHTAQEAGAGLQSRSQSSVQAPNEDEDLDDHVNDTPRPQSTPPDAAALLAKSRLTTEEWYKSKRTTKAYGNYVKAGKAWLANFVKEDSRTVGLEGGTSQPESAGGAGRFAFAGSLDAIGEHTPTVLRLYLAYKCEHEGRGFSTAEGIRSAFKNYFEMYDCTIICLLYQICLT